MTAPTPGARTTRKRNDITMQPIQRNPIMTKLLAKATFAAMLAAAPALAGTESFTDRLVVTDDVSVSLTQVLDGLEGR